MIYSKNSMSFGEVVLLYCFPYVSKKNIRKTEMHMTGRHRKM